MSGAIAGNLPWGVTAIGDKALSFSTITHTRAAIGIGTSVGQNAVKISYAVLLGEKAGGLSVTHASANRTFGIGIGYYAGYERGAIDYAVNLGYYAGATAVNGTGGQYGVNIGRYAGYNETGSYKLHINSSATSSDTSLIEGDFANDWVAISEQLYIGDTSSNLNARAALHLESTTRGFLTTVMTETQRDAISTVSGDAGLSIYNSDTDQHDYYNATDWKTFIATLYGRRTVGLALTPASIGANQNNYNPTDLDKSNYIRLEASAAYNITGIVAPIQGESHILYLRNFGGFDITLTDQDANSTDVNRFDLPANVVLAQGEAVTIIYDNVDTRWISMGKNV
jgi:hypothetical protein